MCVCQHVSKNRLYFYNRRYIDVFDKYCFLFYMRDSSSNYSLLLSHLSYPIASSFCTYFFLFFAFLLFFSLALSREKEAAYW